VVTDLAQKNACQRCGCTEERACIEQQTGLPCSWAVPPGPQGGGLCTACLSAQERAVWERTSAWPVLRDYLAERIQALREEVFRLEQAAIVLRQVCEWEASEPIPVLPAQVGRAWWTLGRVLVDPAWSPDIESIEPVPAPKPHRRNGRHR
jgi:hypothetical protein